MPKPLSFLRYGIRFVLATAFVLLLLNALSHCTTSKLNRQNSLGVEQVYVNPNIYLFGSIIDGQLIDDAHYTVVRFQPYATMSLYDESVLFCGDASEQFKGKHGAILVTYDRRAHRMFRGIACHELTSVFEVPEPKEGSVSQ